MGSVPPVTPIPPPARNKRKKRQQMSKNKKEEAPEVKEVIVEKAPKTSSKARAEFEALIERYKEQNPVKFALKEAELKKKLANL